MDNQLIYPKLNFNFMYDKRTQFSILELTKLMLENDCSFYYNQIHPLKIILS